MRKAKISIISILKYSIMEKQTLSVKINTQLYQQLKVQIGKGKISEFVEKTLTEKLAEKDKN